MGSVNIFLSCELLSGTLQPPQLLLLSGLNKSYKLLLGFEGCEVTQEGCSLQTTSKTICKMKEIHTHHFCQK